tara:strand:+ start:833 stop:1447 length:615 start_codon:yes stop_codon:yes gene_type:complete
MKQLPNYYDDLDLTLKEILGLIQRAVKDRKSGFHNFVLATSFDSKPDARTVVLRGFDSEKMELSFHSDLRSQKINQLNKNKNVCLVFYDEKKKIQLRIRGKTNIRKSFKEAWNKLTNWSKRCYLTANPPGQESEKPNSGFPEKFAFDAPSSEQTKDGLKNFTQIRVSINEIEWLFLASQGHRRALFEVVKSNSKFLIEGKWFIP